MVFQNARTLLKRRQKVPNGFGSKIFLFRKQIPGKVIKKIFPEQMFNDYQKLFYRKKQVKITIWSLSNHIFFVSIKKDY